MVLTLINLLKERTRAAKEKGLWRELRTVVHTTPVEVMMAGQRVISFASNDYLGFAHHPYVIDAAVRATRLYGAGGGASRLVSARNDLYGVLERRLADLKGAEACLVFASGYATNIGVITSLAARGDVIFCDRLSHASLIDAARLSGARLVRYAHLDIDGLEAALHATGARGRRFIVTDTVFSMDGDVADISGLVRLARLYDAVLIADDAHGTGVLGPGGAGCLTDAGVEANVPVQIGTLSKALGSLGGFVCGSSDLIAYLVNRARPLIFSTALPPAALAAAAAALDLLSREPQWQERLSANISNLRASLTAAGLEVSDDPTPIVPIMVGTPGAALELSESLIERGFLVPAIRPPAVPPGSSRLRLTVSACHEREHIDGLVAALTESLNA